jgi:hypothetical protein
MAHLKKGILGTPRGKIGNIMGYQRNGTGVLQSIGSKPDPWLTYFNLVKASITKRLTYIWNLNPPGLQATYAGITPAGITPFDYFIESGLAIAQSFKKDTCSGLTFATVGFNDLAGMYAVGKWKDRYLSIHFTEDCAIRSMPAPYFLQVRAYTIGGSLRHAVNNSFAALPDGLQVDFSNPLWDAYAYWIMEIRADNQAWKSRYLFCDILNPTYYQ